MIFDFEHFVLDTDRCELRGDGGLVAVEPQVFDLIRFVIANRHRVVSRDDLLETVWHGRIVSESTLDNRISAARRALDDSGARQRLIRTIRGKGIRFVGEVVERPAHPGGRSAPHKPTVAVLPFDNLSDIPELGWRAAGMTEDLVAALSQVSDVSVIDGRSTGESERRNADIRRIAHALDAEYVLKGSIRGSEQSLRVTVRLIDGVAGNCIWSDRYDRTVDDPFAAQDDIVRGVLIEVRANLTSGDHARIVGSGTNNLNAWLLFSRAFDEWTRFNRAANARARWLFQKAHEADPAWASPLGGIAMACRENALRGWGGSREGHLEQATAYAQRAVVACPDYPTAHSLLGQIGMETGRIDESLALCEKAVELAPGDFAALCDLANNLPRAGETERALAIFTRAKFVRPTPFGPTLANEGFVLHLAGQREQAINVLNESLDCCDLPDAQVRLAAAYVEEDRLEEARAHVAHVLRRMPDATVAEYTGNLPLPDRRRRAWYQDLLRQAGLPDRAA